MSAPKPNVTIEREPDGRWIVACPELDLSGVGQTLGDAMSAFRAVALSGPQVRMDSMTAPAAPIPAGRAEALAVAEDVAEEIVLTQQADESEAEDGESVPWEDVRAELGL